MKRILLLLLLTPLSLAAQNTNVFEIVFKMDKVLQYKSNLNEGKFLNDLSWAWNSKNACFPETQKLKFTGRHVFFTGIIPAHSITTIKVIPKNKKDNLSVYAYQISENEAYIVPDLPRCVTCEADHKHDYRSRSRKYKWFERQIGNFTAIHNSCRLVIGVTGADNLDEAEFTIEITTRAYR
jgi:hypothetical protein